MDKKTIYWSVGGIVTAILAYFIYTKVTSPNLFGEEFEVLSPKKFNKASSADTGSTFPLKVGSSGNEVVKLQMFLNKSNSSENLVVDGKFGKLTEGAVKRNQDPFSNFKRMYPSSVYGQVELDFYDTIKTIV
jgi:cAMP phosphodiesterase